MFKKYQIVVMAIFAITLCLAAQSKAETLDDVSWLKLNSNGFEPAEISYSPNGKYFAYSALNHVVIYDAYSGKVVNIISGLRDCFDEGDLGEFTSVKFIDNDRVLVYSGEIRIYDAFTSEILEKIGPPKAWEGVELFSKDGKYACIIDLITEDNSQRVVIRDVETWSTIYADTMARTSESPYIELMYGYSFSDDNKYFSYFHEINDDTTYAIAFDLNNKEIYFKKEFLEENPFNYYTDPIIDVI